MSSDESRDGLIASGLGHRRRRIPERSERSEDLKAKKTSNVCDAMAQCATAINCSLHHLKIVLNNYEQLLLCCGAIRGPSQPCSFSPWLRKILQELTNCDWRFPAYSQQRLKSKLMTGLESSKKRAALDAQCCNLECDSSRGGLEHSVSSMSQKHLQNASIKMSSSGHRHLFKLFSIWRGGFTSAVPVS
jgi:hypothetical protein